MYTVSAEALVDVYGEDAVPLDYVKKCTRCRGFKESEDRTNVPDIYHDADLNKFDFDIYGMDLSSLKKICESFLKEFETRWQKQGMGLYLWSKTPGSGKTFLACCLGKSVMIKYGIRFKFINCVDYISKVSESYKSDVVDDPSAIYRECELLVLDDIGAQLSKEWQHEQIYKLVNERMARGLVTIFTSNYSVENLNTDERAKSRIYKMAVQINMPEVPIRMKDADQRTNEFLKGIL